VPSSPWSRIAGSLVRIAVREGPRVLREVRRSRSRQTAGSTRPKSSTRPVSPPTSPSARQLVYAPDLDGRADPGEVVWTWVAYEEDASQGKDRPVLVVGRQGDGLLGLMLTGQHEREGDPGYLSLGSGPWDPAGRPSWVRLDRVLEMGEDSIRREGAVLDQVRFDRVAAALRRDHGWA